MTTTQKPSTITATLNPQDRALVELLHAQRFNLNALINRQDPFHPAQTSILDLLDWVSQPHIDAAIQRIVTLTDALSAKADEDARLIAKKSLSHALAVAASMILHFDSCPDDPAQAELFAKHTETLIRETRLLARTLLKLSPPPTPPTPPRARRSKSAEINDIDTTDAASEITSGTDDAAQSTSSDSTESARASRSASRSSRLNRNSRKPAFSPAEVAEILSALLDHEESTKPNNNTTPSDSNLNAQSDQTHQ
ncbi:MAG: hypothetical protein KGS45_04300 [Planctomycetes bacterium]|nr:hypothetical protein [Planctomycetota bacterium]